MNNYQFNPEIYKTVGRNIKKYRELKNISLEDLSKYADIKKDFLEKFENASLDLAISIDELYKISVILTVSINQFFED